MFGPDPFGDVELHSAAECFIAQIRICDLRVRIVRDGHEPNEAEEQRPGCIPIEPVHVISSPKDRREQEGYQNSGSFGENRWGDFAGVNPLSFAREAIVAETSHALPYRMAMTRWPRLLPATSPFNILRHRSRWRNIADPLEQQVTLCEDPSHHATSLRTSEVLRGAWIASALSRSASITVKAGAPGRHPSTGINVLLLRATRGRDLRAPCPPSRGGRQTS
jgi:hypothetical protein